MSRLLTILLALVLLANAAPVSAASAAATRQGSLTTELHSAAREYKVPVQLLSAMGYVNTHWETPSEPSLDGGWGIMHLVKNPSQNTLRKAAQLTGTSEYRLKRYRSQNIRGGAALLAAAQGAGRPADLDAWYGAVVKLGGRFYADQVFQSLRTGASATIASGERVTLQAQEGVSPHRSLGAQAAQDTSEYRYAAWVAAHPDNYTAANRPTSNPIDKIIIHMIQGSYGSAINWFQNPAAQASANYVVRSKDGAMTQMVHHKDIAYHAGNWEYNQTSIGIEHEGYMDDPSWFTDSMYRSSAKLTAYLCHKYNIPVDRKHIIGHNEVPDPNNPGQYGGVHHHQDPGPYWSWIKYMSYVKAYYYTQVVDNSSTRFSASASWTLNTWNSQRYGSNYRYTTPKAVSDAAKYKFRLPVTGNYAVYAWWPSNSAYNSSVPIGIQTSTGMKWIRVNQTQNGRRWVYLGRYKMNRGDSYYVQISRWTTARGYVMADAVRVVMR